jgi:serine-type D-Ala-D-Ala carboxypeptidase (penicillin-binding protein 5/6)
MSINHLIVRRRRRDPGSGPARVLAVAVVLAAILADPAGSVLAAGAPPAVAGPPALGATAPRVASAAPGAAGAPSWGGAGGSGAAGGVGQGAAAGPRVVAGPRVLAKAAILADESTGQVLFERNAGTARAMASTTKVMTALLTLERLDERRVVVVGPGPPRVGEESLRLRKGERLTVRQLLLGLLVKSANDAAVALAEAVDGSEAAFVRRMNRKAAVLRLGATRYVTPYGLDRPGHQTSARDLARLWEVAMRRADFRSLVATRAARIPGGPLSLRRFVTTNQLLGSYRWTVGGKTGFTNRAGRCLVASASRGGRRLVAVALGSPNAFADVRALFEYGLTRFVRVRLAQRGQPVSVAPGRPPDLQAGADADALVRLDHLTQVRLLPAPGSAAPGTTGGDPGSAGQGAGSGTDGGSGSAAGASSDATSAWFVGGGRRLVRVPLARRDAGGAPPSSTPTVPAPSTAPAPTVPASSTTPPPATGAVPGSGGPAGATLVEGTVVRVWAVPPGAAAPAIDPLLRRAPS